MAQTESPPDATKIDVSTVTVDALMEQHKIGYWANLIQKRPLM
jgi:hypothetical protein